MLPGDAVQVLLVDAPKEYVEEMRHALGLDRPIHVQYVEWIVPLVTRLDMGKAIIAKEPINKMLLDRLPVTMELAVLAMLFSSIIALPLGILAARHRGGWLDYLVMQFSQLGQVVPAFWIGTLLFFALGVKLQVLPSAGWVSITEDPWQNLLHVLMPAVSLALPQAAILTRTARSSLLEVLSQDYIRTAYSKGLRTRAVVWRHALKNALIPILTIGGVQMGYLLGGSIIIEDVFQLPGIGKLAIQNLQMRDIPVVQGCLLFYGSFFVLINLLVDLLYSVVDPRITYD
jgi:peptide/nickel transport system permease protein